MYATEVPAISTAMRNDPEIFARGVMFAVLSIRQPVTGVPAQLAELDKAHESARCLFGFKREAYRYLRANLSSLWERVCAVRLNDPATAILTLMEIPGLGIVKAGFVAQMMGFDVACLDSHNLAREGINPRAFRTDGRSPQQLRGKVAAYVTATLGQAQRFWDEWCAGVAASYKMTPESISELHLAIIK